MASIVETRDDRGRAVALTAERWAHILERHPDMAGHLNDVQTTVEAPEVVTRDTEYMHREVYYRRPTGRQLFLRVVVLYRPVPPQGAWTGEVVTAYQTARVDRKEPPR